MKPPSAPAARSAPAAVAAEYPVLAASAETTSPKPGAEAAGAPSRARTSASRVPAEPEPAYHAHEEEPSFDDNADHAGLGEGESAEHRPHPLDGLDPEAIESKLRADPTSIGSVTLGVPSGGGLFNGVRMPNDDRWELVDPAHAWGTRETVEYLAAAIYKVHERFPGSPKLYIGHISGKSGGHLSPHISHQAGRDVDISYFYTDERAGWYARAGAHNLDLPRTWTFVRALITETDVELILIDRSLQVLLKRYAASLGEDAEWLKSIFHGGSGKRPLILHAKGHATHIHVRFYNPIAQETARRTYQALLKRGVVRPPTYYISHKVKKGETLGMIARKYGVSVKLIKQANGLKSSLIRAKRVYRIPKSGGVRAPAAVVIPPRRIPPAPSSGLISLLE